MHYSPENKNKIHNHLSIESNSNSLSKQYYYYTIQIHSQKVMEILKHKQSPHISTKVYPVTLLKRNH